ncbi:MAG: hypothetical protein JJE13_01535 [Thermoleophilia bacterium]|nr:hypothetical protein [Thermoleophilia bacterium]
MLVVWWAWQFTTWATDELDPDAIPIRLLLIAVIAGPVLYLLSFVPIRWRMTGGLPVKRVAGAAGCIAVGLIAAATHMSALLVGVLLVAILIAVIVWETMSPSRPPDSAAA